MNNDQNNAENAAENRPNAKYALSNSNEGGPKAGEKLNFYYNRERRLENAPDAVKNNYKNEQPVRFGILQALVADKPRRFLLIVIVLMCVGILALSFFGYFDTSYILEGNKIDITAAGYEGTTIVIIRKTAKSKDFYSGAVDIAVSVVVQSEQELYPVYYHRIFFTSENEEGYRFAVPFEGPELLMVMQNEKNSLHIKFKPE